MKQMGVRMENENGNSASDSGFFLSDIIGAAVVYEGKKIGKLNDMVIKDGEKLAEVIFFVVGRPFGDLPLLVPAEKVGRLFPNGKKEVILEVEGIDKYEAEPAEDAVLVKDHVMDKKMLDVEGREVEVVYDVKLAVKGGKLYVAGVDFTRYGLLRRMGLRGLADLVFGLGEKLKPKTIPWSYVQPLPEQISSFKGDVKLSILREKLSGMLPADVADVLEEMEPGQRALIFQKLDPEKASDALEKIDPNVQRELVNALPKGKVAHLVDEMTPGQAADVLGVLPWSDANAILDMLEAQHAGKVKAILEKNDETVLNYATREYISVKPGATVKQVRKSFYRLAKGKKVIMYLFVIGKGGELLGLMDIKELVGAKDGARMGDIMVTNYVGLKPGNTLKEAASIFSRYHFRAIPVTGKDGEMLGVLPYRDVMHLTHHFLD